MKDKNNYFTEIVLLMDKDANIKKIYFDRGNKLVLSNIYNFIEKESIEVFVDFISNICKDGYAPDYLISLNLNGTYIKFLITGIKYDDNIVVVFFNTLFEAVDNEILKINNEQDILKEVVGDPHEIINQDQILREISELNNQLISTQRELAKKNIESKILNDKLSELSITDPLTGLYNRRHYFNEINEQISRAKSGNYKLCMISIDINNFKVINDTYGHDEGDRVLKEFTKAARNDLRRDIDLIYRFGGDEFVFLILNSNIIYAQNVVENLSKSINVIHDVLSLSYGIVEIDTYGKVDIESLLCNADKKMYEYKKKFKESQLKIDF